MRTTPASRTAAPFPHQGAPTSGGEAMSATVGEIQRASRSLTATPQSASALRTFARDVARGWRLDGETEDALTLIVTELVTNTILHSGSPEVSLLLRMDESTLTVEVRDYGHWRPRVSPRREPLDENATCGRGLTLVSAYASRTDTQVSVHGTRVVAHVDLTASDRAAGHPEGRRANPQRPSAAGVGG